MGWRSATARVGCAAAAIALAVGFAGCGDPELVSLVRNYVDHPQLIHFALSAKALQLESFAEEHASTEKQWLCVAAEKATYNESTGVITLPSVEDLEQSIEKKLAGTLLPAPPSRAALNNLYSTLKALNSNEAAKAVADVGCAV